MSLKASIIGVTGYTGLELVRLLLAHPQIEIAYLTSRQHENAPIGEVYPHLSGYDLTITNTEAKTVAQNSDVVFLALPHKTAQDVVAEIYQDTKVIDLSADYRLDDAGTYEKYYGLKHNHAALLKHAVYGAPEFYRDAIKTAQIVANPGCFALLSQFMLYPFASQIESASIFAITGSSGAGKNATEGTHHPVRNHNIKSYNINKHRHIPEITKTAQITEEQLNFVPSSGPFTRGIFANATIRLKEDAALDTNIFYTNEPFVRVVDTVALANIVGSNFCDLSYMQSHTGDILIQGALDNLVKGAAGCAVQNMNIMCGLNETEGLFALSPLYP